MNRTLSQTIIALLAVLGTASAVFILPFTSWHDLTEKSPDIVIARCTSTPNPRAIGDGMICSEIEVVTVLKGDTKPAAAKMVSQYWPHQGEQFLMFSTYQSDELVRAYNATEAYRIIPIDRYFQLSELTGKPLTERVQLILSRRLDEVRKELERGTEEKKRLEQSWITLPDPVLPTFKGSQPVLNK